MQREARFKRDEDYFTLVFKGNIRELQPNPFCEQTVFGECVGMAVGDVLEELDFWEKRCERLEKERE